MSISNQVINHPSSQINAELLEKIIIGNDLSGLNPHEKVQYVRSMCQMLGLNPVTRPIQIMKLSGKETPYFTKDATEQLRKLNKVSIKNLETKVLDGGIYVVTAHAETPDGRMDSSTGVISINGLKGDVLSNAMMKAETKSKRRVTLSICGLGFIDECEVDSIPNDEKVDIYEVPKKEYKTQVTQIIQEDLELDFVNILHDIEVCETLDNLKMLIEEINRINFKSRPDLREKLINAKEVRKSEIMVQEFKDEYDSSTGEIAQ